MKTTTKTFYISDDCLRDVKRGLDLDVYFFSTKKDTCFENEIQISWQEPDKKYSLTVDEIAKLLRDWFHESGVPTTLKEYLIKKLEQK